MASKISHAKQGAERAAYQSPHPGDQALLPKQKHKLLQVPEKGHLAVQRRPDPGPWRSQQPQHWAEELRSGWPEAPDPRARDLDRLHIAHLLGAGGGWSVEPRPDLQGPARRGATGRPRAREKQRAAVRGEKRRQEDLVRLRPYPLKSRRTVVGAEKKGAGKARGLPHPAPGPPEKSKGKRRSSRKTGGGHRPNPRVRGDLDMGTLWASAGGVVLLGDRERDGAPGRRRSPARTARLAPDPKNDGPGQEDNPEPPWPVDVPCGRGASPPVSPPQRREGSKWKRELESVFRELFSTNRKLKTYLEARPGADMCPSEELGFPEPCGCQGDPCWERRAGDLLMELAPGPAQEDALPAVPSTNLKELLCQLKDRQYRRLVEPLLSDEGYLASHPEEESPLWCGLRPRQEPPRPDMLLSQLRPPAQVGRARSEPAWPKQSREQRWRPQLVEVLELPQLSWEALGRPLMEPGEEMTETEPEPETGPQMSAHPAHVPAHVPGPPSPDREEAGECERSTPAPPAASPPAASPPAASSEEEDDNDTTHSQMIRDLEEQILEQSKSHKQFLEQARRRLQEFQLIRAKVVSEKEVGSGNDIYGNPIKRIQYEIKQIKMFKGPDRDIEFIYTAPSSAICGVSLDVGGKKEYLIAGKADGSGKMHITLCDFIVPWDTLSTTQKKSLNHRYQMGCECKITRCPMIPCYISSVDECLWMDWVTEKSINGHQAKFFACIKRNDGSCAWYRGAAPPKQEFLDIQDP